MIFFSPLDSVKKIVCFSWPIHLHSHIWILYLWKADFILLYIPDFTLTPVPYPFCLTIMLVHLDVFYSFLQNIFKTFFEASFMCICACICFALTCSHEENVKIFFPLSPSMQLIELRILNSSIVFCEFSILFNLIQTFGFLLCKRQYK